MSVIKKHAYELAIVAFFVLSWYLVSLTCAFLVLLAIALFDFAFVWPLRRRFAHNEGVHNQVCAQNAALQERADADARTIRDLCKRLTRLRAANDVLDDDIATMEDELEKAVDVRAQENSAADVRRRSLSEDVWDSLGARKSEYFTN